MCVALRRDIPGRKVTCLSVDLLSMCLVTIVCSIDIPAPYFHWCAVVACLNVCDNRDRVWHEQNAGRQTWQENYVVGVCDLLPQLPTGYPKSNNTYRLSKT